MKLTQLQMVLAIADRGSLRAAARELAMTQPSLTQSLRELERELGATLFTRGARGMVPTPVGEVFLRRASVIHSETRRAREEVAQFLGSDQGEVSVCLSAVAHLMLLPMALPLFQRRFPRVRLRLLEGAFPAMENRLREGRLDFYIGAAPDPLPAAEFDVEKLFDNTRAVFARHGHPMAHARSLAELTQVSWVTTGITHQAEAELRELFAQRQLPPPQLLLQCDSLMTTVSTLMATDAMVISLRQLEEVPLTRSALQRVPVREEFPAPAVVIVRRAALPLPPAADYFCDMFRRASVAYQNASASRRTTAKQGTKKA